MKTVALPLLLLISAGCAGHADNSKNTEPEETADVEQFPMPQLPADVTDSKERASMASARFWDNAVLAQGVDTVTPALEQAFANFIGISAVASSPDSVSHGIRALLAKGETGLIMPLAERYLYDPNSPLRSEELFLLFLNEAPAWPRSEGLREQVLLNRVGTPASDFPYIDSAGHKGTLAEFVRKHGETFVYFFDSECNICKELIPQAKQVAGELPVIAVCPESNAAKFAEAAELFPEGWTVARDLGHIDGDDLYIFPALPSVYVIGADMTVLAKDLPL